MVRGIAARDCAFGFHASSFCLYRRPGRFVRYYRPGKSVPGVLAQYRRPEQCVRYAREKYRVYRCPGQGVRDERKKYPRPGSVRRSRTRAVPHRVVTRGSVSGIHVSSISVYRRPGQCVWYRRQGKGVRYGTRAVSPCGALRSLSGMNASKNTVRGRIRRPRGDRYIMAPRRGLARPKEVAVGSIAPGVSQNGRVPICQIAW